MEYFLSKHREFRNIYLSYKRKVYVIPDYIQSEA